MDTLIIPSIPDSVRGPLLSFKTLDCIQRQGAYFPPHVCVVRGCADYFELVDSELREWAWGQVKPVSWTQSAPQLSQNGGPFLF